MLIYVGGRFRERGSHAMVGEAKGARHSAGKLILRLCSIYRFVGCGMVNKCIEVTVFLIFLSCNSPSCRHSMLSAF